MRQKADLNVEPSTLKSLREALVTAQSTIKTAWVSDRDNLVGTLQTIITEIDRHRPLGEDGNHGDNHTLTCGCVGIIHKVLDGKDGWHLYQCTCDRAVNHGMFIMSEEEKVKYIARDVMEIVNPADKGQNHYVFDTLSKRYLCACRIGRNHQINDMAKDDYAYIVTHSLSEPLYPAELFEPGNISHQAYMKDMPLEKYKCLCDRAGDHYIELMTEGEVSEYIGRASIG